MNTQKNINKLTISSLVLLFLVALPLSLASAFSAGANMAGAGVDGGGGGGGTWNNTGRITSDDGSYSTTTNIAAGNNSHTLTASNFNFNIDLNATITGISVSIDRYASGDSVRDNVVRLVKAGAPTGDNNAIAADWPIAPGLEQSYSPTGANALWGTTWTPAQINAANFGILLQVHNYRGAGNRTASVDYISITVSYTMPPTLSVTNSPVTYNGIQQAASVSAAYGGSPVAGTISNVRYNGSLTVPTNAGTYAITANFTPTDTANYSTLTNASAGNFIINKATPTLSVTNSPQTYNGSAQSATVSPSVAGSAVTDLKYNGSSTAPTNQGTYAVTGDFTPTDTTNYNILNDASAGNFIISKRAVTVTADAKSKTYGDTDPALTYQITSGSLVGSDAFSGALSRVAGETVASSPYAIQQNTLALSGNYNLTFIGANFTITTRPVTVTADAKSKTYGATDPALTYRITSGSLVGSDAFTGALSRIAGETVASSPYAIQQNSLALSTNYSLTYIGDDLTIGVRSIEVTADIQTKTYGETDPALTYQITSGSLAFSDTFSGALSRVAGEDVGSYAILQNDLALTSNYNLSYVGDDLTIGVRSIGVTADIQTKTYGNTDPTLTYQITSGSLVGSDAFSGALSRVAGEDVGPYAILQNDLALSSNYALSYVGDDLTIGVRSIEVTADGKFKTYGDTDPALTYQITSGSLAFSDTFSGALSRVAGEDVGPYAILQNDLALTSNYDLSYVGDDLTIGVRSIEVTADPQSKTYGDTDPALTYQVTSGSLAFSDDFSGALSRVAGETVIGSPYAINQGSLALSGNYILTYIGANFTITTRPITVTADAKFKTYGETDPALTYQITSGSLVGSDAFTGALSRVAGEDVGPYAILQNDLALSSNYDLSYVGDNLTIGVRSIGVTADAKSKTYGNTDPALTYQVTSGSLAFSDDFTGDLTRDAGEDIGDHAITQGSLALTSNYNLTYAGDNLTIGVRSIGVTADIQSKTYGDTDPALTYQVTSGSLAFSDDFSGALSRVAGEDVGPYAIQQNTLALSANYDLSYVGDNLTIGVRSIGVTADIQTKTYGNTDPALTYQITSGSLVGSDAFSGALSRVAGEDVGPYAILQNDLSLSSNYDLSYVGDDLTIGVRSIEVTADIQTKTYGNTDPAFTYQISSGSLAFSDDFTGELVRDTGEDVRDYVINQGTLGLSSNYVLTYYGNVLSIGVRSIEVTANPQNKAYGDTDPALTYHISSGSLAFSDAFTGELDRDTGENLGIYTITQGSLGLSSNYDLTFIGDVLRIGVRPIEVTANPQTKTYGDTDPALTFHISSGSLAFSDDFTGELTREPGEDIGFYAINQDSLALTTNYDLTYIGDDLTITPRAITVTVDAKSKFPGQTDPALTYQITSGSLISGDDFTGSIVRDPGEAVGDYAITQGSLGLSSNYDLTFIGANLTIKAWLQVFLPLIIRP